ncbi:MAG TPA: hypothetical protein VK251_08875 [Steroidobacteraceae bacterium]|nr:hypothetical protein [Steroidobacteraceae bacterium]
MSDRRETDFLAYILGGFVIAIGGIAVGVASTNKAPNSAAMTSQVAVTMPTGAAAAAAPSKAPAAR